MAASGVKRTYNEEEVRALIDKHLVALKTDIRRECKRRMEAVKTDANILSWEYLQSAIYDRKTLIERLESAKHKAAAYEAYNQMEAYVEMCHPEIRTNL
jgi:hypothetical protein